jgi:hypothetical protein
VSGPLGSTESVNVNGTEICPLVTWDSKITSVVAMLGGTGDLCAKYMKLDGIYDRFYFIVNREYRFACDCCDVAHDFQSSVSVIEGRESGVWNSSGCSPSK